MSNSNLLPTKNKSGLLDKLKNLFKGIFNKQHNSIMNVENGNNKQDNEEKVTSFMNDLKENTDIESASEKESIEYIVRKIEENPEFLDKIPTKTLVDVRDYYTKKIEEVDELIDNLK